MAKKLKFVFTVAFIVLLLDQLTKYLIIQNIAIGSRIPVIHGFFDLVHGRNFGAAFGILGNWDSVYRDWFFYIVAVVALVFLYFYINSVPVTDRISLLALSLIFGGALGNISDRIFRGSVVDFLSVHYREKILSFELFHHDIVMPLVWPAFNVADMAISCAVVLLILRGFKTNPDGGEKT